jgi:hypothetical protein
VRFWTDFNKSKGQIMKAKTVFKRFERAKNNKDNPKPSLLL